MWKYLFHLLTRALSKSVARKLTAVDPSVPRITLANVRLRAPAMRTAVRHLLTAGVTAVDSGETRIASGEKNVCMYI